MATSGKINGTLVKLYIGGSAFNLLISNELSITQALRAATNKDSAGWEEVLEGLRGATMAAEGYFAEDATIGFTNLTAIIVTTRVPATFRMSSEVSGDKFYEGSCFVSDLSLAHPLEETSTFSVNLKLTGALTEGTV